MSAPYQPKKYLRCACVHCGANVEFPDYAVGGMALCSSCGKSTVTSMPKEPEKAAPSPQVVTPTPVSTVPKAPISAAPPQAKSGKKSFNPALILLVAVALAGAVFYLARARNSNATKANESASRESKGPAQEGNARTNAQAPARSGASVQTNRMATTEPARGPAKSLEQLKVGEIKIQRPKGTKGSRLIYAVGTLTNTSTIERLGIRVDLDLVNAGGAKIDATSDYKDTLAPNEVWTFRGVIHDPLAMSSKLAKISEDN